MLPNFFYALDLFIFKFYNICILPERTVYDERYNHKKYHSR